MYTEEWRLLPHLHEPQRRLQMRLSIQLPRLSSQQEEMLVGLKFTKERVALYKLVHLAIYVKNVACFVFFKKLKLEIKVLILFY